jgi:orotate phosphoribosyltransferase
MQPLQFPASKMSTRGKAFNIIKERSFRLGDFTLASGAKSTYYLDMKPTMFNPEGADVLAHLVFERLSELPVELVGGLEMGAVPLIGPINLVSYQRGRPMPGFFVRKNVKEHGTRKLIETAEDIAGKNVVILDDVTTTGASAMLAVDAVRAAGANVLLVLSIVDREEGATEFYQKAGVPFDRLFKTSDFMSA